MRRNYTPSLGELQAFVAAAECGSATQTAERLGLTQSAVSRSLKALEERLGVLLFHRQNRRLVLSDAGRLFAREARELLQALDESALRIMSFGGRRNVLRISVLPTFGAVWLVPRLAEFAKAHPDVTFDIRSTLQAVDFVRDDVDFAVIRAEERGVGEVLTEERLIVVASPALCDGWLSDDRLVTLPLLQQATRPNLWLEWFVEAGFDPVTIARGPRFEQFGMVLAAARAGMGVALVPEVLVSVEIARGVLRQVSKRSLVSATHYVLSYPERSRELPDFEALRTWLTRYTAV
ncbi:LysR substrate-binding domain-containing protein [Pelagovum sp. HNIBRBA483]|uniref:LysR substrate-binding domain-containing protein n=1 Tax=Pelagovum sp. HNIBRBA483 TaxID=3233341 RepID=UPI0034A0EFA9